MKQIILIAATALFGSAGLMAQNAPATLRSAFDLPTFLTASPDSTIHYDENDKKSTKEENVFNENNFVAQTNQYTWEEATAGWKPDGKTLNTLDGKGRTTIAVSYTAAGEEIDKTVMAYEGDNTYPKTITSYTWESSDWKEAGLVNISKVEVNSAGLPTLIELSTTQEGMDLNIKVEMTYEGDIAFTKMSTDMMGAWMVMSETKSEIIDKGNPSISKNWGKSYLPAATDWTYEGKDYQYFSNHTPDNPSSNETIAAPEPAWHLNGTILEVPAAGNGIRIYAIVGCLVKESPVSTIDVSTLAPGIYIVKTDKSSFKIRF